MAKQIAKREVGLGLNISEFARKAKNSGRVVGPNYRRAVCIA